MRDGEEGGERKSERQTYLRQREVEGGGEADRQTQEIATRQRKIK